MRPNIVWLVFDALRYDRVLGSDVLPGLANFERLTSSSSVFHRAYSPGVATPQVFGTLFTGLPAYEHSINLLPHRRTRMGTTLAGELEAAGYVTMCFSQNPYISQNSLLGSGFGYHFFKDYVSSEQPSAEKSLQASKQTLFSKIINSWRKLSDKSCKASRSSVSQTESLIQELEVFLDLLPDLADRPAFIYINLMPSHYPYSFRQEDLDRVQDISSAEFHIDMQKFFLNVALNSVGESNISREEIKALRAYYDASVYWADELLGRCFNILEKHLIDRPLNCAIFSDHGELLGEHDLYWHGRHFYEPLAHIPLWIKSSEEDENSRYDLVGLDWLFDWTRILADLPSTESHFKRMKWMNNETEEVTLYRRGVSADDAYWYNVVAKNVARKTNEVSRIRQTSHKHAVWHSGYKLLVNYDGEFELFDLERDSEEKNNLVADLPDVVANLAEKIETDTTSNDESVTGDVLQHQTIIDLDDGVENRLRALGYLG